MKREMSMKRTLYRKLFMHGPTVRCYIYILLLLIANTSMYMIRFTHNIYMKIDKEEQWQKQKHIYLCPPETFNKCEKIYFDLLFFS